MKKKEKPLFDIPAIKNQLAQIKFQEINDIPLDTDSEPWMKLYKEIMNDDLTATKNILNEDLLIGGSAIFKVIQSGIERIEPLSDEWDSVKSKMV